MTQREVPYKVVFVDQRGVVLHLDEEDEFGGGGGFIRLGDVVVFRSSSIKAAVRRAAFTLVKSPPGRQQVEQ
jgi:hypothetical protein